MSRYDPNIQGSTTEFAAGDTANIGSPGEANARERSHRRSTLYELKDRIAKVNLSGGSTQWGAAGLVYGWPTLDFGVRDNGYDAGGVRMEALTRYYGTAPGVCTGHHDCSQDPGMVDQIWSRIRGPLRFFAAQRIGVNDQSEPAGCINHPNSRHSGLTYATNKPAREVLSAHNESWCVLDLNDVPCSTCVTRSSANACP